MNALETYYSSNNPSKFKSVCVKLNTGEVKRMKENKAYAIVRDGLGNYCSKSVWKEANAKTESKKEDNVEKEEKAPKTKMKAKERRKQNKK